MRSCVYIALLLIAVVCCAQLTSGAAISSVSFYNDSACTMSVNVSALYNVSTSYQQWPSLPFNGVYDSETPQCFNDAIPGVRSGTYECLSNYSTSNGGLGGLLVLEYPVPDCQGSPLQLFAFLNNPNLTCFAGTVELFSATGPPSAVNLYAKVVCSNTTAVVGPPSAGPSSSAAVSSSAQLSTAAASSSGAVANTSSARSSSGGSSSAAVLSSSLLTSALAVSSSLPASTASPTSAPTPSSTAASARVSSSVPASTSPAAPSTAVTSLPQTSALQTSLPQTSQPQTSAPAVSVTSAAGPAATSTPAPPAATSTPATPAPSSSTAAPPTLNAASSTSTLPLLTGLCVVAVAVAHMLH